MFQYQHAGANFRARAAIQQLSERITLPKPVTEAADAPDASLSPALQQP